MTQPQNASPPPKKSRREMLEGFVAANPKDAFSRYGLAMECANLGDNEVAMEHFQKLLGDHPNYVAAYYQYGQLLARLSKIDDARRTLATGADIARRTGDQHAASEMESALAQLA